MANVSLTTKTQVSDHVFCIPEGKERKDALDFADEAMAVSSGLLSSIIRDEAEDHSEIAWAIRFLIECAQACYVAAGRAS